MEDELIHKSILELILGEELHLLTQIETEKEFRTSPLLRSIRVDTYSMDDMKRIFTSEAQKEKNPVRKWVFDICKHGKRRCFWRQNYSKIKKIFGLTH